MVYAKIRGHRSARELGKIVTLQPVYQAGSIQHTDTWN